MAASLWKETGSFILVMVIGLLVWKENLIQSHSLPFICLEAWGGAGGGGGSLNAARSSSSRAGSAGPEPCDRKLLRFCLCVLLLRCCAAAELVFMEQPELS